VEFVDKRLEEILGGAGHKVIETYYLKVQWGIDLCIGLCWAVQWLRLNEQHVSTHSVPWGKRLSTSHCYILGSVVLYTWRWFYRLDDISSWLH
jgi:hypothetical protein